MVTKIIVHLVVLIHHMFILVVMRRLTEMQPAFAPKQYVADFVGTEML